MKIKKLLLALTSLIIAAEHKAGEAAPAEPGTVKPPLSKAEAIVVEKTASPDNVVKAVKAKKAENTEQTRQQLGNSGVRPYLFDLFGRVTHPALAGTPLKRGFLKN